MKNKISASHPNQSGLTKKFLDRILSIDTESEKIKHRRLPVMAKRPGDQFITMIQKIKNSKRPSLALAAISSQIKKETGQRREEGSLACQQKQSVNSQICNENIQEWSQPDIQDSQSEQQLSPPQVSPELGHIIPDSPPPQCEDNFENAQDNISEELKSAKSEKQEKQRKHVQLLKLLQSPSNKVLVYKLSKIQNISYGKIKELFATTHQTKPFICLVYPKRQKVMPFCFKKDDPPLEFPDYTPAAVTLSFYFPKRIQHKLSNGVNQFPPYQSNITKWLSQSDSDLKYAISVLKFFYGFLVQRLFQDKGRTHNRFARFWIYQQGWKLRSSDKVWFQALEEQLGKRRVETIIEGLSGAAVKSVRLQKQSSRLQEIVQRHSRASEIYKECQRLICHNKFSAKRHSQIKQSKVVVLQEKTQTLFRLQEGEQSYWVNSSALYQQFDTLLIIHFHPNFTFVEIEVPCDKHGVKHFYWNMHLRQASYLHIDFKERVNCRLYQEVYRGEFEQKNKLYLKSIVLTLNTGNYIFLLYDLPGHASFKFTTKVSSKPLVKLGSTLPEIPDSKQLPHLFESIYRELGTPLKEESPSSFSRAKNLN